MKRKYTSLLSALMASLALVGHTMAQQTVTVNLGTTKQTIRGFGGMIHLGWQGYDLNTSDRELAFGNGPGQIGLTVLRIPIYDVESSWNKELSTAKYVVSKGGIVYASPWTPPAALRTPYTFNRGTTSYTSHKIPSSNYTAYVTHLNKFAKYMKDNGAPLYAISMQNEPDWCDAWTCWSADEVYNFVKSHAAGLRQQGTKVITAESFAYSKGYYDKILNDAAALSNVDIIGAHFYASDVKTADGFFQYPLADQKATTKERWMTEHYTDSKGNANLWRGYIITGDQNQTAKYDTVRALDVAYEIHRGLVEGNFNQYTWWYIRRNYGLIMHDATDNVKPTPTAAEAGKVSKRGYCVAQFAKFVRPGAIRVDATKHPDTHIYISAFTKADSVVIVAVNRAGQKTINFSVPAGTSIKSWKKYTTSATKNVNDDGSVTATNGSFSAALDQESVTTFVGITTGTTIPPSSTVPVSSAVPLSSSSAVAQGPYKTPAAAIPGQIEAENYDIGGEDVAYHDEEAKNKGNIYRTDGVDITGDATTGYKVGWTVAGEWLEYTVNVAHAATYSWSAHVASGADNASFKMLLDNVDITGAIVAPNGGNWDTYFTLTGLTTILTPGLHVLKIAFEGSYVDIDWIKFELLPVSLNPSAKDLNVQRHGDYQVYSFLGSYIGTISMKGSSPIQEQVAKVTNQPGVYLVKHMSSGKSFQVRIPN